MNSRMIQTARGARVRVFESGPPDGQSVVFLHGVVGLVDDWRFLDLLSERHHVFAPELPGYGESRGEGLLEDMLDFALHGWDVLDRLESRTPVLIGHSLGGMIAAEMACLAPSAVDRLVLVDAFGVWLDEYPIPDLFALRPFEFGELLFHDQLRAEALLAGATDVADLESLRQFLVDNARRLGTAGKILFPIPNRRVSKRLYRVTTPTLVVWAAEDRLMPPVYGERWKALLPDARLSCIGGGGHMLPYEQPDALAAIVREFLRTAPP
jgi:pimeloyl-ACP methyl ester carboxylesterase